LFEINEEGDALLTESIPYRGNDTTTIEIVNHCVPAEEAPGNPDSSETVIGARCRWRKRFPKLVQFEENHPNNDVSELGKVMIQYKSLPSPATVFVCVCKLD